MGLAFWAAAVAVAGVAAWVGLPLAFPKLALFHWVWPAQVDPSLAATTRWFGWRPHAALSGNSGLLHVFLHGTAGHPSVYSDFLLATHRAYGHHTLGLAYLSSRYSSGDVGIGIDTRHPRDEARRAKALFDFHATICLGGKAGPFTERISASNSIVGRLHSALEHLADRFPEEGWQRFLGGPDGIRWERIVLSGHSQGGAHAAFLAHQFPLRRVALLSAPQAITRPGATFLGEPLAAHDVVAFAHSDEDAVESIREALAVMRVGPEIELDAAALSDQSKLARVGLFRQAGAIYSAVEPRTRAFPRAEHCSVALNGVTPLADDGEPLYAALVWPKLVHARPLGAGALEAEEEEEEEGEEGESS